MKHLILLFLLLPSLCLAQVERSGRRMMGHGGLTRVGSTLLPFTDSMSVNGSLGSRWTTAGSWTVSGGTVTCSPTLGAELITNGGMDTSTGWTVGTGWSIASGIATASTSSSTLSQNALTVGKWYQAKVDMKSRTAGNISLGIGSNYGRVDIATPADNITHSGPAYNAGYFIDYGSTAFSGTVDNASCKLVTFTSSIATVNGGVPNVDVSVGVTFPATQSDGGAGVVVSYTDTLNFVVANLRRTTVATLNKYVNGTHTVVISGAITYSAGAAIRVTKSGNNYSLYYNGTQVGSTTAINNAAIVSNTRHGIFSMFSGNTLDNFSLKVFP